MPEIAAADRAGFAYRPRPVPAAELFIREAAVIAMTDHADAGYPAREEVLGLMTGRFHRDDLGVYAVVTGTATSDLDADAGSVRFRRDGLEGLFAGIDANEDRTVVGWYHSHPGFGCYLSDTDKRTHAGIFGDDPGFAAVIDPADGTFMVFTCRDGVQRDAVTVVLSAE